MNLTRRFQQILDALPVSDSTNAYLVAYSGGVDSHVLLHLCKQAGVKVRAIHINHGLQQQADEWTQHCSNVCTELDVAFLNINVQAKPQNGDSPENAARKARYTALYAALDHDECLLTAHHLDDQSETLLLQLFRGAGPAGLAAMPLFRNRHARPMLEFGRDEIMQYARAHDLSWVEDPSNKDTGIDRNLVRNTILPLIKQRWPKVDVSLSQVAVQQQQTLELMEAMAAIDLAAIVTQQTDVISASALNKLSRARQLNVLRYWIHQYANDGPTANALLEIIDTVLNAADDAEPVVSWGRSELRRYRDGLYLMPVRQHDEKEVFFWTPQTTLRLKELDIDISVSKNKTPGLNMELLNREFSVRFRTGGERIRPVGRGHTHSLKKLMQDADIPPWLRARIPLLYLDDELVCVCGYWLAEAFVAKQGEEGWLPTVKMVKSERL